MNTDLVSDDYIKSQLKTFSISDAAIEELSNKYMPLIINGLEDKEGYKSVVEARKHVKSYRVEIGHRKKELNADALKFQRAVNGEAARLTSKLEVIEEYLLKQEDSYEAEKEKIKQQKSAENAKIFANRILFLCSLGFKPNNDNIYICEYSSITFSVTTIMSADETLFKQVSDGLSVEFKIHADKKAEEKHISDEAIRIEREKEEAIAKEKAQYEAKKLEEERVRQEEVRKSQEIEQKRLKAIADDQTKISLQLHREAERIQREEKAKLEKLAEEKRVQDEIENQKALAIQQEKGRIAEQERLEAMKPDVVKLTEFHIKLFEMQRFTLILNSNEAVNIFYEVHEKIRNICKFLEDKIIGISL